MLSEIPPRPPGAHDHVPMPHVQHHTGGGGLSILGHNRRGRSPSSRTTIMYCVWRCMKWFYRVLQIISLPGHPYTGHAMFHASLGMEILYIRGSSRGGGVPLRPPVPSRADYYDGSPGTPPSGTYQTRDKRTSGGVSPGVLGNLPSS